LSLTPRPPEIDIEQGDKLGHLLAYGTLMLWFAQHRLATQQRLRTALGLVALGVALEFVQRWTGYRTYSYADMAANTAGVLLGWLLAPPRLPNLSALAEQMIVGRGS
jgi:VanZ family protein